MSTKELVSREQFFSELEAIGEDRARAALAAGKYEPRRRALAEEWLRLKREQRVHAATRPVPKHHETPTLKLSFPPKNNFALLGVAAIVLVMVAALAMSIW